MTTVQTDAVSALLRAGRAYALCARLCSPQALEALQDGAVGELTSIVGDLGLGEAVTSLQRLIDDPPDADAVRSAYTRIFVRAEVPPYETSQGDGAGSAGGKMQQMADLAGFYKAFGFEVSGERPDHIAPQLEFLALTCVKEGYAGLSDDDKGATVCRDARRAFLADHVGAWLPGYHERLGTEDRSGLFCSVVGAVVALNGVPIVAAG